jgi:hypothetical protein
MPPPRPHRQPTRRREVTLEPEDLGRPPEPAPSPSAGPGGCRAGDRTHTTHDPQIVYTLSWTPSMPGHPIYEHALLSTQKARRLARRLAMLAAAGCLVDPEIGPARRGFHTYRTLLHAYPVLRPATARQPGPATRTHRGRRTP